MLDRRTLIGAAAAGAAAPLLVRGPAAGRSRSAGRAAPADRPLASRVLARDLRVPWGLAFLPSGDALVGERVNGRVHRVRAEGGRHRVGTLEGVADRGEGGLLGLAVSPTFRQDRWVYAYLTTEQDNRIVRCTLSGGSLGTPETLLTGIPASSTHNGGRLAFGPDGLLYAGTGDAGDGSASQDLGSLAGKILRLNPDGSVPDGNPFDSLVWSYGHRNVQGLSWDGRGRMWAAELGQNRRDELNRIRPGRNYGWPEAEGPSDDPAFTDPFVTWSPAECSPSGVAIARGRAWVGALRGQCLWSVRLRGPHAGRTIRHLAGDLGRIRTVQKAPDGSLWITTSNRDGRGTPGRRDDRVVRLAL